MSAGDWAYDRAAEVWRPLALIEPGTERADLAMGELEDLLDRGEEVPAWFTPPAVAAELRRARPPRSERGLVIFLTGLSGSGKSTIARGLRDALSERGDRSVSLLDGDLVRELLSAGLTFSRADRDLNIARIGFVATEVARHGGIAICAPIAPYAEARGRVRSMVREVGDFLLVHVATPVQVCEARDRKGLYAKARAGVIDNFTGVSDPYEEPTDAELTIDTSAMSRQQSVNGVLRLLIAGGWLPSDEPAPLTRQPYWSSSALAPSSIACAQRAEPAHQRPGHRVALAREQDVAGRPADHEGQREQQQAAGAGQVDQADGGDEKQDPCRGIGECGAHDVASLCREHGGQLRRIDVAAGQHGHPGPGGGQVPFAEQAGGHRDRPARFGDEPRLQRDPPHRLAYLVVGDGHDVVYLAEHVLQGQRADLLDPERVGDRPLGVPRQPGHLPAAAERVTRVGRQFGLGPDHPRPGHSARMAAAIPEMRPPPPTGTTTWSASGRSAAISRPMVPWPAMTARSSKGGMSE